MTTLTTGQAVVKSSLAHGVDTMFGIPGAHMYDFNDALYEGRLIGADLTNPDFVKLAQSFGALGYRATSAAELKPILKRALKDDAPVIIEVTVDRGSEVSPWSFINPEFPQ